MPLNFEFKTDFHGTEVSFDLNILGSFDEEPKDKSNEVLRDLAGTEEAEKRWTDSLSAIKKKPADGKVFLNKI